MIDFFIIILGFIMGIVGAISGGGGVFAVPTMLALGFPAVNVLVLNRVSDLGTVIGSLKNYHKAKSIDWKLAFLAMTPLGLGAFIGSNISLHLPEKILKIVILGGVFIGIYFLLKPLKEQDQNHPSKKFFGMGILVLVGVWSGMLGMAGSIFAVLVIVYFFNKTFLVAKCTDMAAAIPETIISVIVLYMGSSVGILKMLFIFIPSLFGSWVGSKIVIKHGDKLIKRFMIGIALVMIIKVVFDLLQ